MRAWPIISARIVQAGAIHAVTALRAAKGLPPRPTPQKVRRLAAEAKAAQALVAKAAAIEAAATKVLRSVSI